MGSTVCKFLKMFINVFGTGPIIEPKKLLIHGSLADQRSNHYQTRDIINIYIYIYILLKFKKLINKNNKYYLNFNNIY